LRKPFYSAGLALKLAVEVQRRGLSQIAPLGEAANALPAEDDPFFASCFSDDDCLLRHKAAVGARTAPPGASRARLAARLRREGNAPDCAPTARLVRGLL